MNSNHLPDAFHGCQQWWPCSEKNAAANKEFVVHLLLKNRFPSFRCQFHQEIDCYSLIIFYQNKELYQRNPAVFIFENLSGNNKSFGIMKLVQLGHSESMIFWRSLSNSSLQIVSISVGRRNILPLASVYTISAKLYREFSIALLSDAVAVYPQAWYFSFSVKCMSFNVFLQNNLLAVVKFHQSPCSTEHGHVSVMPILEGRLAGASNVSNDLLSRPGAVPHRRWAVFPCACFARTMNREFGKRTLVS